MLTPAYQSQTGRDSYDGFWSTIESVDVSQVDASGGGNTVDATLTYHKTDGSQTTEQHQLELSPSGDSFKIAGDGPA